MDNSLDFLLRYVSNETYKKILTKKSSYVLNLVKDNYVDTDLNIKYLIKYGITNIDKVIYEELEDLTSNHNDYINKIKTLERSLSKEEIIMLISNT